MKPTACPSREELSAYLLGKLPEDAAQRVADHSSRCASCQKALQVLDGVTDPLVAQLRQKPAALPELAPVLQKAAALGAKALKARPRTQAEAATTPPDNTLSPPGEATQSLTAILAPAQAAGEIGRLGSYSVQKVLGQGGMGVVFQAEDPQLKRPVALKAMLPDVAAKAAARERFLREARAAAAIEHDHIVTIYQVGEDRGVPFLAMQFLKGMSLEDFLKKQKAANKPLTWGQILKLGREIAKGLGAAHDRGLIHRDIKPANIWLDATAGGRVKILDFGLARGAEDAQLTQSGMIVGTAAYMAPEQAKSLKVDGRADLYSLGCVLYRLCTGRTPFIGPDAMAVLIAAATEEAPPVLELNKDVPPDLAALTMKLLAKKPEDRPESAADVVKAIAAIEKKLTPRKDDDETAALERMTAAPKPGIQRRAAAASVTQPQVELPRRSRKRWAVAAAAVLTLGVAAALALVVLRKEDAGQAQVSNAADKGTGKATEPAVAVAPPVATTEVDLLKLIDRVKNAPRWRFEGQTLVTPGGAYERLPIPYTPPAEYEVEMQLKRVEGKSAVVLGLVGGGRPFHLMLDGTNSSYSGLALLDSKKANINASTFRGSLFTNNKLSDVLVRVQRQGVTVHCDGTKVIDYKGDYERLTPDPSWAMANPEQLSLGIFNSAYHIRKLTLRPLTGGTQTIDLLKLTDPKRDTIKGEWSREDGALVSRGGGLLELPYEPQGDYELVLQVQRRNGTDSLSLVVVHSGRQFAITLDSVAGIHSGLNRLDNKAPHQQDGKHCYRGRLLLEGATCTLHCTVRKSGVVVRDNDGRILFSYAGDLERLSLPDWSAVPNKKSLALSSWRDSFAITKATLTPLSSVDPAFDQWARDVQKLPPEEQVKAVAAKLKDLNPGFDGKVTHRVQGNAVDALTFSTDAVADVSPLRALTRLRTLYMDGGGPGKGRLADIGPLIGMPIMWLSLHHNPIADWTPLAGLPLKQLSGSDNLKEAAPMLRSMKSLETINNVPVAKVAWLQAAAPELDPWARDVQKLPPEEQVKAVAAKLQELNPGFDGKFRHSIKQNQVRWLNVAGERVADISPLRALTGLEDLDLGPSPGAEGQVAGLAPLRGLRLRTLVLGKNPKCGDLTPLLGMPLTKLTCPACGVRDLGPLQGMPLIELWISSNPITDLSPLRGMPLQRLTVHSTNVADLKPLAGMPLEILDFVGCPVTDIAPLAGMPLVHLTCCDSVTDLAPLRGSRLQSLRGGKPERHLETLRSVWTLTEIGRIPVLDFWKQHDPKHAAFLQWIEDTKKLPAEEQVKAVVAKLKERNPGFDGTVKHDIVGGVVLRLEYDSEHVTDIAPLRALAHLEKLSCMGPWGSKRGLADLTPLAGMKLKMFTCQGTMVADLTPLRSLPLTYLNAASTPIADLRPLAGMQLSQLVIHKTGVTDLAPLKGMTTLSYLRIEQTQIKDLSAVQELSLTSISCAQTPIADLTPVRNMPLQAITANQDLLIRSAALLRSIKTLEKINDKPAADFWKEVEAKKP